MRKHKREQPRADFGALGTEAPASALTAIVSTTDVAASRLEGKFW
jgi:hypothetical protein